ncbi:MAG TPA: STAS domain-containing protein, partial [Nocardioidaceae bacterium]|nr:STAS domain-containing protein [Nocardioidaceae bacterium]
EVRRLWRVRRTAFTLSLVATAGVVFFGVLEGILIAVALAILLFFRRSWWPHGVVLGRDATGGWHTTAGDGELEELPGIVVYRWEAPLFFANAGMFHDQVRKLVRTKEARWVVLQCEAITDIDVTAAEMLDQADRQLNARGVHMAFVELRGRLQDLVLRYGLLETLDKNHFYPSVDAALEAIKDLDAWHGTDTGKPEDREAPG